MVAIAELKSHGNNLFVQGRYVPALQIYDSIVAQEPLDYEARMRVADCLRLLKEDVLAAGVYKEVAEYALLSGHPLLAIVLAKILEDMGVPPDPLYDKLSELYGEGSPHIGKFAGRINLPDQQADHEGPDLHAEIPESLHRDCATRARTATAEFSEYPAALHPIPLLSDLSKAALSRVLKTVSAQRLGPGQYAIRAGEPAQSFYFLAAGQVRVVRTDATGKENELARLGEHAIFGEMALVSQTPRTASVCAVGEVDLVEFGREALRSLADELPQVALALHEFTRKRLLDNLMGTSPFFQPFSVTQRRDLLRRCTDHDVAAGTDIIHKGDDGHGVFFVVSGELEVVGDNGVQLAILRSGDVCGEMSIVRNSKTTAGVRSLVPSSLLFLPRDTVVKMIEGVPEVKKYLTELTEAREYDTRLTLGEEIEDTGGSILV